MHPCAPQPAALGGGLGVLPNGASCTEANGQAPKALTTTENSCDAQLLSLAPGQHVKSRHQWRCARAHTTMTRYKHLTLKGYVFVNVYIEQSSLFLALVIYIYFRMPKCHCVMFLSRPPPPYMNLFLLWRKRDPVGTRARAPATTRGRVFRTCLRA